MRGLLIIIIVARARSDSSFRASSGPQSSTQVAPSKKLTCQRAHLYFILSPYLSIVTDRLLNDITSDDYLTPQSLVLLSSSLVSPFFVDEVWDGPFPVQGGIDAVRSIVRTEGVAGLFKGC